MVRPLLCKTRVCYSRQNRNCVFNKRWASTRKYYLSFEPILELVRLSCSHWSKKNVHPARSCYSNSLNNNAEVVLQYCPYSLMSAKDSFFCSTFSLHWCYSHYMFPLRMGVSDQTDYMFLLPCSLNFIQNCLMSFTYKYSTNTITVD